MSGPRGRTGLVASIGMAPNKLLPSWPPTIASPTASASSPPQRRDGVRPLGVGASALEHTAQTALFAPKDGSVDATLDHIRARFGGKAIIRGALVNPRQKP